MPRYQVREARSDSVIGWSGWVVWDTRESRQLEWFVRGRDATAACDLLNAGIAARAVTETLAPNHPNAARAESRLAEDLS